MTAKLERNVDQPDDQALLAMAHVARAKAYVPYSHFRVGAAVMDDSNRVFTGCNIENASYGATCCAERTAIFKAVSEGARAIRKIAVTGGGPGPCMPCGICRQVMAEFAESGFYLVTDAEAGAVLAQDEPDNPDPVIPPAGEPKNPNPVIPPAGKSKKPADAAIFRLSMQELLPHAFKL